MAEAVFGPALTLETTAFEIPGTDCAALCTAPLPAPSVFFAPLAAFSAATPTAPAGSPAIPWAVLEAEFFACAMTPDTLLGGLCGSWPTEDVTSAIGKVGFLRQNMSEPERDLAAAAKAALTRLALTRIGI
ncbi:MAG: hypothetical protein F4Z40_09645 [Chloroflexi bacterium]|nr:hypothetical protein [Chloroflexota bacterium]